MIKLFQGKQRSLILLIIVQLTTQFRGGIISPILSLFIRQQGLGIAEIGILGTSSMIGWFIFEPLMGFVADRIRKKYLILFAVVGSTIIYTLYPQAYTFTHFALLAFGMSSVMSAYAISVKALTAELLPKEARGKAYGKYLSLIGLGGIIAPMLGGYLTSVFGYTLPFYLSAGIGIITFISVLLMPYDDKAEDTSNQKVSVLRTMFTPGILGIFTVRGLFMYNLVFRLNFLPIFLNESSRFLASETEIGVYMTLVRIASTGAQAILGDVCDRIGSSKMILGSVILLGISYFGFIWLEGVYWIYVIGLIQGVLMAASDLSMMLHLMSVMPEGRTGIVMGFYSESENIGGMIVSPATGYLYSTFGASSTIFVLSMVLIGTGLLSNILLRKKC